MTELIIIFLGAIVWFLGLYFLVLKAAEGSVLWLIAVVVWGCSPLLLVGIIEDDRPCVRYETTFMYNYQVRASLPVSYCAQYGEWIEDD